MQVSIADASTGKNKSKLDLADQVFAQPFNESLVHQIVVAYLSKARAGTHAQKTRAQVRGGGKKPWKQKGTGRARAGSSRSPIWRSGGVAFAAQPRDYSQKVNKKMYKGALRAIWSELIRQDRLHVVEAFELENHKTNQLIKQLGQLNISKNVLIVLDDLDKNLTLASRNLSHVEISNTQGVDPVSLIKFEHVLTTEKALKKIEESLA